MINLKKAALSSLTAAICLCFTQCTSQPQTNKTKSVDGYNFADPKIINLPQALDEISGIAYYAKDTSVFAIIDEAGIMFKIPLNNPNKIKEWQYDKQRDFEDIILRDSVFYVLISNGDIDELRFVDDKIEVNKVDFPNASKKVNEFESLYFDSSANKIIMLCKHCEDDKKTKVTSFFLTDSSHQFSFYNELETEKIFEKLGEKKENIKPSAAAINPITKDLFILCSVNKLLIIVKPDQTIKDVVKLDPKIYKQPEGMTFTPTGDLIISNEVYLEGYATLLLIKNNPSTKNDK